MVFPEDGSVSHFFFFNDTATTEIYTLSLHDALPISVLGARRAARTLRTMDASPRRGGATSPRYGGRLGRTSIGRDRDRKSTRLNSSHSQISYAVFCLKKKKNNHTTSIEHHQSRWTCV